VSPFFIVGSGRSGSTLLRMMISAHSRITVPPETWFLIPLVESLPLDGPLTRQQLETAVALMTDHYRWPDMGIDAQQFRDTVFALASQRLVDVVGVVYDHHSSRDRKPRWGDKTPGYVRIIPQLTQLYPDAKFLHLVRDGRDVVKSMQSTGWYGPWLHNCTTEWRDAIDCAIAHSEGPLGARIMEVRYEDLVLDSRGTLGRICAFLGEEFEPGMLSWQGDLDDKVPQREEAIHRKLRRPPNAGDIERWKREMSSRELLITEAFLNDHLRRMNYPARYGSPLWTPIHAMVRLYCRTVLPLISFAARVWRYGLRKLGLGAAPT
jgi:hypothetical protein